VVTPIPLSGVAVALDVGRRSHIALVGGGGKTTLLHALGDQLRGRVVLTTTTRMGADQHDDRRVLLDPTDDEVVAAADTAPVVVWTRVDGGKAIGVDPARCDAWFAATDHVVVEADGSRGRPFKAPNELEPVVPSTSTLVLAVVGADAFGRVIADQCHRPLRVAALAGCYPGRRLDPELAARVILHERGVARACPSGAELVVAITKVDDRTGPLADRLVDELRVLGPTVRVLAIAALTADR
jgi:probable selenium-dependent hydroxylase accessory protein YqeC